MKVISFYNIKGGVGKTTFAVNVASEISRTGLRTILWDLDPQGSATFILRAKPKLRADLQKITSRASSISKSVKASNWPLLDLLPADFELRNLSQSLIGKKHPTTRLNPILKELSDTYDVIIIDCPPEVSLISENIIRLSTLICAPVLPNAMSLNTLDRLHQFVGEVNPKKLKLCAAFNFVDRRKNLHKHYLDHYLGKDPRFLTTFISSSSDVENMTLKRAPIEYCSSRSQAAHAFRSVTEEIFELIE